jgi:hypothetical protein
VLKWIESSLKSRGLMTLAITATALNAERRVEAMGDIGNGWAECKPLEADGIEEMAEAMKDQYRNSLKYPRRSCCGSAFPNHYHFCIIGKIERGEIKVKKEED